LALKAVAQDDKDSLIKVK